MIHFFPELAALYHRSLLVSLENSSREKVWKEWIKELWDFCPEKINFYSSELTRPESNVDGFFSASLGKRNKDNQKIMGFCTSLEKVQAKDEILDYADSIFIEVDPGSEATDALFDWQIGPTFSSKKIVWCMRSPFSADGSLHEKALDKKLAELAPESLRILWPKGQFIRDALEWVLSF